MGQMPRVPSVARDSMNAIAVHSQISRGSILRSSQKHT